MGRAGQEQQTYLLQKESVAEDQLTGKVGTNRLTCCQCKQKVGLSISQQTGQGTDLLPATRKCS